MWKLISIGNDFLIKRPLEKLANISKQDYLKILNLNGNKVFLMQNKQWEIKYLKQIKERLHNFTSHISNSLRFV